jgi:hypothetical protein
MGSPLHLEYTLTIKFIKQALGLGISFERADKMAIMVHGNGIMAVLYGRMI